MAPSSLDNALPLAGSPPVTPFSLRARRVLASLWHIRRIFSLQKAPDPSRPKDHLSVWFEDFLSLLGVEIRLSGERPATTAFLIVPNHTSWLDIMVLRALFPTCFIAKEEIAAWPVVGPMAKEAGTIFIGRGRLSSFRDTLVAARASMDNNVPITVFPEGTTTRGDRLLPFKTGVFELCTETGRSALPVSLRYEDPAGRQLLSVSYTGNENFFRSFGRTLREPRVVVRTHISPPLSPEGRDRKSLSQAAQEAVSGGLALLSGSRPPVAFSGRS
ncbi:MAG: lysophospholipid acyltransferase family protein [Leptospirillia bacterium]